MANASMDICALLNQIYLLLWKRYTELVKQPFEVLKLFAPPLCFFFLILLIYAVIKVGKGIIEPILVPLAFWVITQKTVVYIMYEKFGRLQEAMKMMGLREPAYWIAYFIFDGLIMGFILSILCMSICSYGLFNDGNLGSIFFLLYTFCIAIVPFSFWLSCFFDLPQSSGQATIAILLGFYVTFFSINLQRSSHSLQTFCCLFPPLALQLGCNSFGKFYKGISLGAIVGMLVCNGLLLLFFNR